jgi:hypothetical protein
VFKANRIYDTSKLLPVLWFSEGMAEFESVGYDAAAGTHRMDRETEMYVRDAVINSDMPTIRTMRLYPDYARAYKFGHALVQYLGARKGADHLHTMLSNWHHIFPNRGSYNLLRKRELDSFDPLNPGVGYLDPAFIRVGGRDVRVVETERGWLAEAVGGLVDSLEGAAVDDWVLSSENIQLDDEWYRIVAGQNDEPAFYRPDRGLLSGWEGESADQIIRREKDRYEEEAYKLMSFDRLLAWWYDSDLKELSRQWHEDVEAYYGPWLEGRTRMTDLRGAGAAATELWPTVSPDGRLVLYKAYVEDYAYTLLAMDLETGQSIRLARDNSPEIESLHVLAEGGDLWPMEQDLYRTVFTAKLRHRDVVFIQDLFRHPDGRLELRGSREIGFDPAPSDLVGISGVRFAGSSDRIIFTGLNLDGFHDIYLADLNEREIEERLTTDLATDRMPVLWNDQVLFVSDRASPASTFAYHLFSLDLNTRRITQITDGTGSEKNPSISSDGTRVFFESDATGVSNIYEWDGRSAPRRITDVATGVFAPVQTDPDTILVSGFHDQEFKLYLMPLNGREIRVGDTVDASYSIGASPMNPDGLEWANRPLDPEAVSAADRMGLLPLENSQAYRPSFSLDDFYASSEFGGYQTYNASVFGTAIRFSDILGEHVFGGALWNGPREGLKDLSWVASYWNQKNRLKWGGSVYRTSGIYFNLVRQDFYVRDRAGFNAQFNLPFSQFSNVDLIVGTAGERRSLGTIDGSVKFRELELGLGYTRDVSSWGPQGPVRGWVFSGFYDHIFNASDKFSTFSNYVVADLRGYLQLNRRIVAAGRVAGGYSGGTEPEFFFLGGGFFLRGFWDLYSLYGSEYLLANTEVRMQILEMLGVEPIRAFEQIGWPLQLALFAEGARARWQGGELGPIGSAGASLRLTLVLPFVVEYAWYRRNFWEKGGKTGQGLVITLLF